MKQFTPKSTMYYDNFKALLMESAALYGSQTAITTYDRQGRAREKTYTDVRDDAFAFARALYAHGLAGKHIAIVGENSYQWLITYFGIAVSGGTAVCIDIEHSDDIVLEMIRQADAVAVVASEALADLCAPLLAQEDGIQSLIVIGRPYGAGISLEDFLGEQVRGGTATGEQAAAQPADAAGLRGMFAEATGLREPDAASAEAALWLQDFTPEGTSVASIVYTSGTTSTAKPVMLSHRAILYNAADSLTLLDSRERVFNSLPLYHTYGLTCGVLCAFIRGLNICISCDMKRLMQEMTLFKPGMLVAVPLIIEIIHKLYWSVFEKQDKKSRIQKMIKLEGAVRKPGSLIGADVREAVAGTPMEQLDVILSGGAYLSAAVAGELYHFGVTVLQGYGITECAPSISCNRNEDFSPDSVGAILPGYEVRFEDDEILVKGYSLMNGYYGAPELTRESFTEDGWFRTGDLGYMDKRGHLHITGRKKNLIVMKNGKKVAAEEMENELMQMPLVKEVLVYGALSGNSADDVKIAAAVYPDPLKTENMSSYEILEKLQAYVDELNKKLPLYKQVQMVNIQEKGFEHTSAHKIKRNLI